MVAECYRLRAFVVAALDASGAIVAGIPVIETRFPFRPKRLVALPFTDYCPPLANTAGDGARLIAGLNEVRRTVGAERVEVRGPLSAAAEAVGELEDAGYRHVLALESDANAVYARFSRSQVHRNIRKAEASGLTLRIGSAEHDLLDDFYGLHLATRRRLGVPIQPRRFFHLLRERILRPGIGWVVTVESAGRPVAAALFLASPGTVVYKYGASDADAWNLRPNHLLFWSAIRAASEAGHRQFDFGRSDHGADGLRAFKRSWGADEERLVYHGIGTLGRARTAGASPGRARQIAETVIRRSPPWVCRWSGELLYRFVA